MINFNFITTFLLIFTILVIIKSVVEIIQSLVSNPPKPLVMSWKHQILLGFSISYTITFFIYLI